MDSAGQGAENDEAQDGVKGLGKEVTKEDFFGIFRAEHGAVKEELRKVGADGGGQGSADVNAALDALLARAQALEDSFTRTAHILPAYDVQQYRAQLRELCGAVAARREELAPRRKFQFKRREGAPAKPAAPKTDGAGYGDSPAAAASVGTAALPKAGALPEGAACAGEVLEGLQHELVVRRSGELDGQDVTLRKLTGCRVLLHDRIGALHCHELRGCEVQVGAVGSSALLYGCSGCVLTLATKQLRLHDSERMLFHLHTLSGPVIEHSQRIAFAPFDLTYPGSEAHAAAAALGAPAAVGAWSEVQDFNWHKKQASPNWCLLPEHLRRERLALPSTEAAAAADGRLPPDLPELQACDKAWQAQQGSGPPGPTSPAGCRSPGQAPPGAPAAAPAAPAAGSKQGLDSDDEF